MRVQVRLFRNVAHALLVCDRVALDGLAVEKDLSGVHLNEPGDPFHGGGFAGAVRPQVPGHFAGACRKTHTVNGGDAGKAFGNATQIKHGFSLTYYVDDYSTSCWIKCTHDCRRSTF